jgi:hypothetical protein
MAEEYFEKVRRWESELDADYDYAVARGQVEYFSENLFDEYKPTKAPGEKRFKDRLSDWLNNTNDETDQKVLFDLVAHIFFVGSREFDSLYQAAFDGPIARWLIDQLNIKIDVKSVRARLATAVRETWFCAITDSMQIAEFYHLNHIEGVDVRPVWRTLFELRSDDTRTKIDEYMLKHGFKRIVLLEDFVGSGSQMAEAVKYAAELPTAPPILLCPMIICPKGAEEGRNLQQQFNQLSYEAVFEIPGSSCLSRQASADEDGFMTRLRETILRLQPQLTNPKCKSGAFGFRSTGALVVMHTNCPNNTLPIIHHASNDGSPWSPLFRRSER